MNTDSTSQRIWQHSKATGVNKLMLLALAQHADINKDNDGFCWPSYQTLGGMVGLTGNPKSLKRNAIRNIAPLIKSGEVITWEQQGQEGGRGYTNIYLVTVGLTNDQIKEIVQRRFNLEPDGVEIVLSKVGAKYDTLCSSERVSIKTLIETRAYKKGDISITHKAQEINKGDKGDTRLLESSSLESSPIKESKVLSPKQHVFMALSELCHIDLKVAPPKQIGQLDQASVALSKTVVDVDLFKLKFNIYWTKIDWRGKQGQAPTPAQVREVYGDYCHWLDSGEGIPVYAQKASQNGHHSKRTHPPIIPSEAEQDRLRRMAAATVAPDDS